MFLSFWCYSYMSRMAPHFNILSPHPVADRSSVTDIPHTLLWLLAHLAPLLAPWAPPLVLLALQVAAHPHSPPSLLCASSLPWPATSLCPHVTSDGVLP